MRRRKRLAVVGLAVLVAVGALVLWPRPDRITRENGDRIKDGMSRAEVGAKTRTARRLQDWNHRDAPVVIYHSNNDSRRSVIG
jgi:hypothetical protein